MSSFLHFDPAHFTIELPFPYTHGRRIFNFEAVTLPCPDGKYPLHLRFHRDCGPLALSFDHMGFIPLAAPEASLETRITEGMLGFDFEAPEWTGASFPLESVALQTSGQAGNDAFFEKYIRRTGIEKCNLFEDWAGTRRRILDASFEPVLLEQMRDAIVDFSASHQVLDPENPHFGAIYSPEEDKYCFRDAIFAACCFMRRYLRTQNETWRNRARLARDYSFRGQYRTGGSAKDGCWAAMGIIDDSAGKRFRRITDPWAQASGVDSALICIYSDRLRRMGLDFSPEQIAQMEQAVCWLMRNKVSPGWFAHHEGAAYHCANMNFLGSSMVFAVERMLQESGGRSLPDSILQTARDAFSRVMETQQAIGVFPYRTDLFERGGAYDQQNLPDMGMGLQAAVFLLANPCFPLAFHDVRESLRRAALWYLLTSRFENGLLQADYRMDREFFEGLAFGNFTWCRIMMLFVISSVCETTGDTAFWHGFLRSHLRTIKETLWNGTDPTRSPLLPAIGPVKLVSWIRQNEWAALVFDDLAIRFGADPLPPGFL
ncbi:MAG: hypothetical protein BWY31_04174 [Lentisphaerae bacterium ADurb.Bin242]|nr:MAG: hypothetical protein BWY31_04174 [Lentisphaerae bacterium ADurb.Bin242]